MTRILALAALVAVPASAVAFTSTVRVDAGPEVARIDLAGILHGDVAGMPSVIVGRLVVSKGSGPFGCEVWYEVTAVLKGNPPPSPVKALYCAGHTSSRGRIFPERPVGTPDYLYSDWADGLNAYSLFGRLMEGIEPYSYSLESQADVVESALALVNTKDVASRSRVAADLLRSDRVWRRAVAIGAMDRSPPGYDPDVVGPAFPTRPNRGEREALLRVVDTWIRQSPLNPHTNVAFLQRRFDELAREEQRECGTLKAPRCGPRNLRPDTRERVEGAR